MNFTTPKLAAVAAPPHPDVEGSLRANNDRAAANSRRAQVNEERTLPGVIGRLVPFRNFTPAQFFNHDWTDENPHVAPHHARYLQYRANSQYVVNVRGTHSAIRVGEKTETLEECAYDYLQVRQLSDNDTGSLMFIPLYSTEWGPDEHVIMQVRADNPRKVLEWKLDALGHQALDDDKKPIPILGRDKKQKVRSIKFEVPARAKRGSAHGELPADVHPLGQDMLEANPMAPLAWTEGAAKADAILSAALVEGIELVPVALTGVTMGYKAASDGGQPTPQLAEETAGKFMHAGRLELLCWDSDWRTNRMVAVSLLTFGRLLEDAGATVMIVDTPGVTSDGKGGIDDYLYVRQQAEDSSALADLLATQLLPLSAVELYATVYSMDDVGRSERLTDTIVRDSSHAFDVVTSKWNSYDSSVGIWTDRVVDVDVTQLAKNLTELDRSQPERFAASRSARAVNSAVALASHSAQVQMRSDDCDLDPYLLNTHTGVVDLRTGDLLPHDPGHWMRKLTVCGYDPAAECPTFDAFILQCVEGDVPMRDFLQRFFGMALIGTVKEEVMAFITGGGRNGKSTLMKVLQTVLGSYARTFPAKAFTGDLTDEMLIELLGVRLAVASETGAGNALDEQALKQVTSGDTVSGRALYQARVTFEPSATMALLTNHRPSVRANDEGTWRRMRIVPFEHQVSDDEKDPDLAMKLEAESAGILRWLVEGCLKFQAEGLGSCPVVDRATWQYRSNQDLIGLFIKECLVPKESVGPNMYTKRSEMKLAFDMWLMEQGSRASWKLSTFREALQERGALPRDTESFERTVKGYPRWNGIGLLAKVQVP
jgi:P4 family phage/plasmid primase-like protien